MTFWKATLAVGAVATVMAGSRSASATSDELLCYTSATTRICLGWNGPFDHACHSILSVANRHLPVFLGLEQEAALRGRRFAVRVGHFDPELSIDGNVVDVTGQRDPAEMARIIAQALGCEPVPRYIVPAFSLQLELLPPGADAKPPIAAWNERLPDIAEDLGLLSHDGDCDLRALWAHTYPHGSIGVRYGVFATFASTRRAIAELQLAAPDVQIVRTTLRADSLEAYFYLRE